MEPKPEKVNFIPCLTWVKQGKANAKLDKMKPSKEELQNIIKEVKLREAEYNSRPNANPLPKGDEDEDTDEENKAVDDMYDMDNYDNENAEMRASTSELNMLLNETDDDSDDDSLDSDEEPDEVVVQPEDNIIICGHVEGDVCMLEAYVFNNEKGEFFILHDTFLPTYPICVEWLDFNPKDTGTAGHFAAIGCMAPEIGIWDMNLEGSLEPAFKLGSKKLTTARHHSAILDLAWNRETRNVLASGSADQTVLLWDLATSKSLTKLDSFEGNVQSLKWHDLEPQSLLTGCSDGKARLYDCRNPKHFKGWAFEGEVERVMWNNFDPLHFFATMNTGMVHYVDIRNVKPIWNLKAHDKEVTGITLSSSCKDMLVTASYDEAVKVWDLKDGTPQLVTQKNMSIGRINTIQACPEVPYVFCAGGSSKNSQLYVWDARENDAVMNRFKGRNFEKALIPSSKSVMPTQDRENAMDTEEIGPQPSTSRTAPIASGAARRSDQMKSKGKKRTVKKTNENGQTEAKKKLKKKKDKSKRP